MVINSFLLFSLTLIVYLDIQRYKIYNVIVYPFIFIGFFLSYLSFGTSGIFYSMTGFLSGFCICLIPYNHKICGVGEFKLLSLIGVLKGWTFIVISALLSYLFIVAFHALSLIAKGSSKTYFQLIVQYGIDISTIIEENIKKFIIPYSLTVSLFSIMLMLLKV